MHLPRLVLVAIGAASALIAVVVSSAITKLGAPTPATVAATVGVFYLAAFGLLHATTTLIGRRA